MTAADLLAFLLLTSHIGQVQEVRTTCTLISNGGSMSGKGCPTHESIKGGQTTTYTYMSFRLFAMVDHSFGIAPYRFDS